MRHGFLLFVTAASMLSGCATERARKPSVTLSGETGDATPPRWEALITAGDRVRLAALAQTWATARAAIPARLAAKLAQEGPLLDPAAALDLPTLPPGPYYCRLVRLGGRAALATYKPDFCTVDGTAHSLAFTKQSGSILPGGWLFPDTDKRQVFLGSFRATAGKSAAAYGTDAARDVAGVVERVGSFRWRLVLTRAGGGAALDIYELVPVTPRVPGSVPAVPES